MLQGGPADSSTAQVHVVVLHPPQPPSGLILRCSRPPPAAADPCTHVACCRPSPRFSPRSPAVQYNDNSVGNPGVPPTPEEVQLYLINLTGKTIPAGTQMPFKVAVFTLGNPSST
jgi:hypothetical protein